MVGEDEVVEEEEEETDGPGAVESDLSLLAVGLLALRLALRFALRLWVDDHDEEDEEEEETVGAGFRGGDARLSVDEEEATEGSDERSAAPLVRVAMVANA